MELFFMVFAFVMMALFLLTLARVGKVMDQRNSLATALYKEHRQLHECVGPVTIMWDGTINHARGKSDGRS